MNPDGTGVTQLTSRSAHNGSPAWSPDGSQIAFTSDRDGNEEIYVMNANGTGATRLTNHSADDWSPAWSPDGRRIAFVSDRDGNWNIHVMNADGHGIVRLTDHFAADWSPAWSPDGRQIAFTSDRDGNSEIYVLALGSIGRATRPATRAVARRNSPASQQSSRDCGHKRTHVLSVQACPAGGDSAGCHAATPCRRAGRDGRWHHCANGVRPGAPLFGCWRQSGRALAAGAEAGGSHGWGRPLSRFRGLVSMPAHRGGL